MFYFVYKIIMWVDRWQKFPRIAEINGEEVPYDYVSDKQGTYNDADLLELISPKKWVIKSINGEVQLTYYNWTAKLYYFWRKKQEAVENWVYHENTIEDGGWNLGPHRSIINKEDIGTKKDFLQYGVNKE